MTNSGTAALHCAVAAARVRAGDEVIVPAFSFVATPMAVLHQGAAPVFCDIDAQIHTIDPRRIEAHIGPRTRAIMPVHAHGLPADMAEIRAVARRNGLAVIEDAAQAHGATWRGRRVGSFGRLAGWSFYPSKNLGCFGDGGAVTGADAMALARVRLLANHGRVEHYKHGAVGTNSRLDALQAAVLNLRLARLERDNERRRALAARYRESLAGVGDLRLPAVPAHAEPVWHQLTVRTASRDALRQHLLDAGIGTAVFYPIPLHRQPGLASVLPAGLELPASEAAAREVLCLPLFPQLGEGKVDEVCAAVRSFFGD
jgi:dTDP-4-amino-4,6-dideoxygalactose transaminase